MAQFGLPSCAGGSECSGDEGDGDGDGAAGAEGADQGQGGEPGAKKKKAVGLRVNTTACSGKNARDLFALVAKHLGWREVCAGLPAIGGVRRKEPPTIYCIMQTTELLSLLPLPPKCWATRYLCCPDVCDKGNLARMIWLCQDVVADDTFAFNPTTWLLPDQEDDLKHAMSRGKNKVRTVIVKPEDGSQGDGIFLVQSVRDLEIKQGCKCNKSAVAQTYLDRPLLIQGFKFDFRIYVVLIGGSGDCPPRTFLCREGMARFCTEPYEAAAAKNLHKCMGHLTNYSLNKRSDLFEHSGETMEDVFSIDTASSKRPLTVALRQIVQEEPDFDTSDFYDRLAEVVQTTVSLFAPCLSHAGRGKHGTPDGEMRCLQVLGFDVMLDSECRPYLLEVNNSPSLAIDEALPLEPDEAAAYLEGLRGKYRSGAEKARGADAICRCMDMAQPHRHRTSMVDVAIKQAVMTDALRLVQRFNKEGLSSDIDVPEGMLEVHIREDPVYDLVARVESVFHRAGGAPKAFTSSGMRRSFHTLCGKGSLMKTDLDVMAAQNRQTKFTSRDVAAKPDALRIFDYLLLLRQLSAKAFPNHPPQAAVQLALAELGV